MPPLEQQTIKALQDLRGEYDKLSAALQPDVFKVFNAGLGILQQLLPIAGQFAKAAAPAIEQLMTSLSKDISSPGFHKFIDDLLRITPGAITALGNGILGLFKALGALLDRFTTGGDASRAITVAFDALQGVVYGILGLIDGIAAAWKATESFVLSNIYLIITGAAKAFGWIPGLGPQLQKAAAQFDIFRAEVLTGLGDITTNAQSAQAAIGGIFNAVATAGGLNLPAPPNPSAVSPSKPRFASGGVTAGGWSLVGELGPELVRMPAGATVYPAGATAAMLAGGGLGGGVQVVFSGAGATSFGQLVRTLWPDLMMEVRLRGGGGPKSVQIALGQVH